MTKSDIAKASLLGSVLFRIGNKLFPDLELNEVGAVNDVLSHCGESEAKVEY